MSFDAAGLGRAIAVHGPCVRVVVAEVQGSAPREVGAAMLVWADGQSGTIGGGALEFDATRVAREMLAAGEARRYVRAILGPDLGQCCGGALGLLHERFDAVPEFGAVFARPVEGAHAGAIDHWPGGNPRAAPDPPPGRAHGDAAPCRTGIDAFEGNTDHAGQRNAPPESGAALIPSSPTLIDGWFIEPVGRSATPVWIWGAGHVGRALAGILGPHPDLAVTLVDTAPDRFPDPLPANVTARVTPDIAAAVADAPSDARHFVLSYSHDLDFALCDALLRHGFDSLGLIGSATKWARFRTRLGQNGHGPDAIARIRCPIGTPALGKSPESIAVGVAYALLMDLAKKEAEGPVAGSLGLGGE